jgi:hypothetical protein
MHFPLYFIISQPILLIFLLLSPSLSSILSIFHFSPSPPPFCKPTPPPVINGGETEKDQKDERSREHGPWPYREAPKAPWWPRQCRWSASSPHPDGQVPPWLLRQAGDPDPALQEERELVPHRQPGHHQLVAHARRTGRQGATRR